jgi:hypothetical protein
MLVDGTCRSKVTEVIVSVKAILTEIASAVAASDSVNQITTGLMSLIFRQSSTAYALSSKDPQQKVN